MLKLFYSVNHSGCAWWRARQPADMIKKLGLAEVEMFSQHDTSREDITKILEWADVVIAQSPAGVDSVALSVQYQKMGKVVIADYDDLVYSCSPFNPAYKTLGTKNVKVRDVNGVEHDLWKDGFQGFSIKDNYFRMRAQEDIFKIVDGVTVTTELLKEQYIKENPQLEGKVVVIPNSIDFNLFKPFPKKESDRIRIGWVTSSSHLNEIWIAKNVMRRIFDKYGNKVVFVQQGDLTELTKVFSKEELEFHSFLDLSIYPLKFASLNLDIGICPLVDDEFNRHKSQLKWSEYASFKVPSVCSKIDPYDCVEDGITGMLAKTEDEFVEKLSKLIDSKELREQIGQNAYEKNYKDFNLEKNAKQWVDFYEDCYARAYAT
jgi:glycosyltransferase involved in cell wall biosynthesis